MRQEGAGSENALNVHASPVARDALLRHANAQQTPQTIEVLRPALTEAAGVAACGGGWFGSKAVKRLGLTNSAPMCVGGCVAAIAYQIQEVVEEEPVYETELERIQAEAVRPQKTLRLGLLLLRRQNQVACRKGALSISEFCARRRRLRRRRMRRGRRRSGGRRERRASRRARTWSPRRRRRLAPADGTSRSRAPNFSLRGCLLGGAAGSDLLPVRWCAD